MRRLCIAAAGLLLAVVVLCAQTKPSIPSKDEAATLLARAAENTNLRTSGALAFHLRVKAKSFESKGEAIEGTYELWWASPERWREETNWAGATRVKLADDSRLWIEGEDTYGLDRLRLSRVLDFWSRVKISPGEHVTGVQRKEFAGVAATCMRVTRKQNLQPKDATVLIEPVDVSLEHTVCLDSVTNLPLRVESGSVRLELGDYAALGMKRFPHNLRQLRSGKPLVEADVESLDTLDAAQVGVFTPPAGAVSRGWCADMVLPLPLHLGGASDLPVSLPGVVALPPSFNRFALVVFDVDTQGHVLDVKAFDPSGHASLKDSERRALLKSAFKPANCQGRPIQAEFPMQLH